MGPSPGLILPGFAESVQGEGLSNLACWTKIAFLNLTLLYYSTDLLYLHRIFAQRS